MVCRYRWRLAKQRAAQSYKGNGHGPPGGELLTPVKPPRISYDYEINSGSLVHQNGFKTHHAHHGKGGGGDSNTADNPDLILETNNTSNYQVIKRNTNLKVTKLLKFRQKWYPRDFRYIYFHWGLKRKSNDKG